MMKFNRTVSRNGLTYIHSCGEYTYFKAIVAVHTLVSDSWMDEWVVCVSMVIVSSYHYVGAHC